MEMRTFLTASVVALPLLVSPGLVLAEGDMSQSAGQDSPLQPEERLSDEEFPSTMDRDMPADETVAASPDDADEQISFSDLDANGNGVIDREEAQDADRLAGDYDAVDANSDGVLDEAEFSQFEASVSDAVPGPREEGAWQPERELTSPEAFPQTDDRDVPGTATQ